MSLENLLRIGKLKPLAADEQEIARLLDAAEGALRDAARQELSSDSRFALAYRALMRAALAALRTKKGIDPPLANPVITSSSSRH